MPRDRRRTHLGILGAIAAVALLVSACGADSDDGINEDPPSDDVDTTDEPEDDGSVDEAAPADPDRALRVAIPVEPPSMNPVNLPQSTGLVWGAFLDPLIGLSDDFAPDDSGLVLAWEQVEPETWRFTLREGVTFHNGEPFNAAAMAFTIDTYRESAGAPMAPYLATITDMDPVEDLVLDVTTDGVNLSIPAAMSGLRALPPGYYAEVGAEDFGLEPIGTGPFEFESWTPGSSVEGTAFADHWRGTPSIPAIEWSFVADGNSRASLVQTDQADLVVNVPVEQRQALRDAPGIATAEVVSNSKMTVFLMTNEEQLADTDLREAVALAMDRQGLTEGVLQDEGGSPSNTLLGGLLSDQVAPAVPSADVEAARALVEGAGGASIQFHYAPTQHPSGQAVGEAIAGMLEQAGFEVERNAMDYGALVGDFIGGNLDGIVMFAVLPVFPHPHVYAQGFLTSTSITRQCDAPEVLDGLAVDALAAEDFAASDAIYLEMEQIGVQERRCIVPLYDEVQSYGFTEDLTGFQTPPATIIDYFPLSF